MVSAAALALVVLTFLYSVRMLLLSRQCRDTPLPAPEDLLFVFLVPCLNEEKVIAKSLERLLAIPGHFKIMVIDDASADGTADVVRGFDPDRVWLFQRTLPDARKGKGEALNAAYRHLCTSGVLGDCDPASVIVAVLDADGRLAPNALIEVAPFFADPTVGGVQIGVRMYNAKEKLLARMQDFEFVTFTEVFQRARQRIGSVGLGGNGQFNRLAALRSLGSAPWTRCLTEDLDLGIQLLTRGWLNCYCPTTHVSQQAVVQLRRLVRQRARWYQGNLQCWARIPEIVRSTLPRSVVFDLLYQLLASSLILVMSVASAAFLAALGLLIAGDPAVAAHLVPGHYGLPLLVMYALAFGPALVYGPMYWLLDRETSLLKSVVYAHLFTIYAYMWVPAGWRAVWRTFRRRQDWAKTARTVEVVKETCADDIYSPANS
jgi:cellulose synthase/poly-beta-1,6-N-acetylglucosamine synthase-like glycosyltransferase